MQNLLLYLAIYISILLVIAFVVSRREDSEDFLISGRNRSSITILLSKFAGAVGASYFITYTAYSYQYGLGIFALIPAGIISYLIFAYWATPKIYKFSREKRFYTQGDFAENQLSSSLAKTLTNYITIISQFAWLLIGIVGGAKIMEYFGLISYEYAVLMTASVVLLYITMAGFKAVLITDIFQSLIILILLLLLTFNVIGEISIAEILSTPTENMDIATSLGFFLYGFFAVFAYADRYQLCYAAKSAKHAKHGMSLALIPILTVWLLLIIVGLFIALQSPGLDPDLSFLVAIKDYLPESLIPVGIVLFFAGLMSSTDTQVYTISSHYVLNKKQTSAPVNKIRLTTIILIILSIITALIVRDIVKITILSASISIILSIPMIYLLLGKTNPHRFIGSILGGGIGLALGIAHFGVEPSIVSTVLLGSALGLFYNRR